jgi:hypothetical protein
LLLSNRTQRVIVLTRNLRGNVGLQHRTALVQLCPFGVQRTLLFGGCVRASLFLGGDLLQSRFISMLAGGSPLAAFEHADALARCGTFGLAGRCGVDWLRRRRYRRGCVAAKLGHKLGNPGCRSEARTDRLDIRVRRGGQDGPARSREMFVMHTDQLTLDRGNPLNLLGFLSLPSSAFKCCKRRSRRPGCPRTAAAAALSPAAEVATGPEGPDPARDTDATRTYMYARDARADTSAKAARRRPNSHARGNLHAEAHTRS